MLFSDFILLLGLSSLAGAYPSRGAPNPLPLSKHGLDLEAFKLPPMAEYISQDEVPDELSVATKRADYTETAKDLVKLTFPKATFRIVNDYYTGSNGITHVNFKQTANGIDIDNADFNINVSD
jgi:extracellular elastinolytic metalloproteinase